MKIFKYMLYAVAALLAAAACNKEEIEPVSNPQVRFCAVDDTVSVVSELAFDSWSGFQMVDVHTNTDWKLECNADWITLSNHSGTATNGKTLHLKVTVAENKTGQARRASITLSGSGKTAKLAVVQDGPYVDTSGWITAQDAGNAMKVGLNLYNSLDAVGDWFEYNIDDMQTCWGNPLVTADWFNAVSAYGFNAVRIPITWYPHLDDNNQVNPEWMDRVEEVVNFALDADLYCIINVHHDTGNDGWLCADLANLETISAKYTDLWTQIATRFKDYGERLMFESYNEILDADNSWVNPDPNAYTAVNSLAQAFVDTVRGIEGNEYRNLVVNTYCASGASDMLDPFVIPDDKIPGHLMVEVHNYSPGSFTNIISEELDNSTITWTSDHEKELAAELDILIEYSNNNHIPLIVGEFGANEGIADVEKGKYAEYMVTYCRQRANISLFYWSNVVDRYTFTTNFPNLMNCLLKANEY